MKLLFYPFPFHRDADGWSAHIVTGLDVGSRFARFELYAESLAAVGIVEVALYPLAVFELEVPAEDDLVPFAGAEFWIFVFHVTADRTVVVGWMVGPYHDARI